MEPMETDASTMGTGTGASTTETMHPTTSRSTFPSATASAPTTTPMLEDDEVLAAIRTLEKYKQSPSLLYAANPHNRNLRVLLATLNRQMGEHVLGIKGLDAEELSKHRARKKAREEAKAKAKHQKDVDRKYINGVQLRAQRIAAMKALTEMNNNKEEMHALLPPPTIVDPDDLEIEQAQPETDIVHLSSTAHFEERGIAPHLESLVASTTKSSPGPITTIPGSSVNQAMMIRPMVSSTTVDQSVPESNLSSTAKRKRLFSQRGVVINNDIYSKNQASNSTLSIESSSSMDESKEQPLPPPPRPELNFPRSCYICKQRFTKLHFHYDQLCPDCANLNWEKRIQKVDLSGRVIILTGCRVKIGYCCGLRLLRCGATVIGTSRFPRDTARRYAAESDYNVWKDRLHIYGLDLRDLEAVHQFVSALNKTYTRLDALINNAAQTVRRPTAYYRHLIPIESLRSEQLPMEWKERIRGDMHGRLGQSNNLALPSLNSPSESNPAPTSPATPSANEVVPHQNNTTLELPITSALLSQVAVTDEDKNTDLSLFPLGKFDVTGQQLDLRNINSWLLTLDQVHPAELLETFAINALSPFLLCAGVRNLMKKTAGDKYIVNVGAMEGKFYRHKSPFHPHTNMAKAALNMLTRTSAQEYAAVDRIYITSVDTGWINDENVLTKQIEIAKNNFQTPIDEEDAMARILDPIFEGYGKGLNIYGVFLKDFHETEW